jgi:antitoxin HicB
MKNKNIGSNFDDFLKEEGMLAEVEAAAAKRVISYQISQTMKQKKINKSRLANQMGTSRSALERLLEPKNVSVTLLTLEKVALALGKKLRIQLA